MVLRRYGIDSAGYSFAYVANWIGGNLKVIRAAGDAVAKLSQQIIDAIEAQA